MVPSRDDGQRATGACFLFQTLLSGIRSLISEMGVFGFTRGCEFIASPRFLQRTLKKAKDALLGLRRRELQGRPERAVGEAQRVRIIAERAGERAAVGKHEGATECTADL